MPRLRSEEDLKSLIIETNSVLPPQQQLLAEFILNHLEEIPFFSVPVLSQRTRVSEATVVRFAQKIGFSGFSELKMELMELYRKRERGSAGLIHDPLKLSGHDTLSAAGLQAVSNIQNTLKNIDKELFSKLVSVLYRADHVYCFGMGVSSYLSDLLAYELVQIGLRATSIPFRTTSPLEQMVPLRVTDLLVVFSFSPYSKATIEMVEEAKIRGIQSIAFCDKVTAPVVKCASHAVPVRTDNMMFTNSLVSIVVLLNALVTEIAVRHGDSMDAVARINAILENASQLIIDTDQS